MKLRLIIFLALADVTRVLDASGRHLKHRSADVTIASDQTLQARAATLQQQDADLLAIVTAFAGKSYHHNDIDKLIDQTTDDYYKIELSKFATNHGKSIPEFVPWSKGFDQRMKTMKPSIMAILLKDDYPELFQQLTSEKMESNT